MLAAPVPSDFETRTNATYEALMWALSRPGQMRQLPASGFRGIVETLVDRECAVFSDDAGLKEVVAQTGAALVTAERADHLFLTQSVTGDLLRTLRQGSDLYPEDGATLVAAATLGDGPAVRLSGPGVDGTVEISVGGLPAGFWETRRDLMRYPQGFELFLLDNDKVVGVPRSTVVEVL